MASVLGFFSQFVAVLLATLIGVYLAFRLDRFQRKRQTQQQTIDHLRSIKNEIQTNKERIEANQKMIRHLQQQNRKGNHYILTPLETDAWLSALEEPIVGIVSNDVYEQLQDNYSKMKVVNSLIDRQKSEMHHPVIGSEESSGTISYEVWTISVEYYDITEEEVDYLGLGVLIWQKLNYFQELDSLVELLDEEIKRLNKQS